MDRPGRPRGSVTDPRARGGRAQFSSERSESRCAGAWLFASLSIWGALLRAPLNGACSLLLAVGLGRVIGGAVAARGLAPRRLRYVATAILGLLAVRAAFSSGWQAIREYRSVAGLPRAPSGARNVVLIVWDTVRAYNVSSYGSSRDTTPNLSRWARNGVQYDHALAAAPWTYPSHSCFMTGQWPFAMNTQWKFTLDGPACNAGRVSEPPGAIKPPGLRRTQIAALTNPGWLGALTHFEDYPFSPRTLLTRTVPGKWMLQKILTLGAYYDASLGAFYDKKWAKLQSRGAREINTASSTG